MNGNLSEIYDLNKKKSNYRNLKNDLKQIIRDLNSDDVGAALNRAASSLKSNYTINGSQPRSEELRNVSDDIDEIIYDLRDVVNSIDNNINSIDRKVDDLKDANNKN